MAASSIAQWGGQGQCPSWQTPSNVGWWARTSESGTLDRMASVQWGRLCVDNSLNAETPGQSLCTVVAESRLQSCQWWDCHRCWRPGVAHRLDRVGWWHRMLTVGQLDHEHMLPAVEMNKRKDDVIEKSAALTISCLDTSAWGFHTGKGLTNLNSYSWWGLRPYTREVLDSLSNRLFTRGFQL